MSRTSPTTANIAAYTHLVHRVAASFARRLPQSVLREDLFAAGMTGLFNALRSSEHTCEEMFAGYACIRIRGAIIDELRRNDWSPRRRRGPAAPVGTQQPSVAPPAPAPVQVVGFDDLPPTTSLCDEGNSPLEDVETKYESRALRRAIGSLPERERAIISLRYFDDVPSKTIAQSLQLSEARVSQLHARAMGRLKDILSSSDGATKLAA